MSGKKNTINAQQQIKSGKFNKKAVEIAATHSSNYTGKDRFGNVVIYHSRNGENVIAPDSGHDNYPPVMAHSIRAQLIRFGALAAVAIIGFLVLKGGV